MARSERSQLRKHFRELGRAAGAIGHDVHIKVDETGEAVRQLPSATKRAVKNFAEDVGGDLSEAGRRFEEGIAKVPGDIRDGMVAVRDGTVHAAVVAKDAVGDALTTAGAATKEGTKNTFATLAGVKRKPIKEWHNP